MAKALMPAPHLSLPEVEKQEKLTKEVVERVHWQIIRLLLQRRKITEIAQSLGLSVGWVRAIVRRYNAHGPKGLADRRNHNGGHNALLTESQRRKLLRAFGKKAPPTGGLWTCWKVAAWIKAETGKDASVGTGWEYLKRLGFSLRVLRPRHRKADAVKQEEFKKKSGTHRHSYPAAIFWGGR